MLSPSIGQLGKVSCSSAGPKRRQSRGSVSLETGRLKAQPLQLNLVCRGQVSIEALDLRS